MGGGAGLTWARGGGGGGASREAGPGRGGAAAALRCGAGPREERRRQLQVSARWGRSLPLRPGSSRRAAGCPAAPAGGAARVRSRPSPGEGSGALLLRLRLRLRRGRRQPRGVCGTGGTEVGSGALPPHFRLPAASSAQRSRWCWPWSAPK